MKLHTLSRFFIYCASVLHLVIPHLAYSANQTLGGVAAEGELRIVVTDTGEVRVARHNGTEYQNFWYSGSSVGSRLSYNDGSARSFRSGSFFSSGTTFTTISNATVGNTVTTVYRAVQGGDNVNITQTTVYTPGTASASVTWVLTNNYGVTVNDLRWFFGGDTFLLGDDDGTGFFSSSTGNGRVGVNKPGATGEFSIEGLTPHHGYDALRYSTVQTNGNAGALSNQVVSTVDDMGMAMEWRVGSLAAGASWTIEALISTTMTFNTPTPTPSPTPTTVAEQTPAPQPTAEPGTIEFELVSNNSPIENALVYLPEAGTCLTNASGRCTIPNLQAGRLYQAHIQKSGVQFTTPSLTVLPGQVVSVDGAALALNTTGCKQEDIAPRLHQAAQSAVLLRDLALEDNEKRAELQNDEPGTADAVPASQRVSTQLMNYLGASRGIPEVITTCPRVTSCVKTRISKSSRQALRELRNLQREALLPNRILRDREARTEARSRRRGKLVRDTGDRAFRILKKIPHHTWTCPAVN